MGLQLPNDSGGDDDGFAPMAEINVTPLVDVMLVLLIIFMVAAPLMMAGVPVNLPQSAASRQPPVQKPVVVTLGADRALYIRDQPVTRDGLVARLSDLRGAEGDAVAYIRADRAIPYGEVMAVLGEVAAAGYSRISLLSELKAKQ